MMNSPIVEGDQVFDFGCVYVREREGRGSVQFEERDELWMFCFLLVGI